MELQAPKPPMAIEGLVTEYYLKPADMTEWHTPVADLFVLAHMGIPEITLENWSLRIDGLVENPLELTFDELLRRPKRVVETVHQCAGNPMNPTTPARQIANVRWAGIDLRDLLAEIGVQSDATHLWAYGLDHGEFAGVEQDCYLKDIPISRIDEGDVLIAYELNDEELSLKHGFPARLIVPGFFGTNSVKWLSRLHVAGSRADSLFTTRFYNDPVPDSGTTRPVWEIATESVIVSPGPDDTLRTGDIEVWGWAWSASEVQSVDVSTDGGITWLHALLEPRSQRSWQRFSYQWSARHSGTHVLLCRATDIRGETQPLGGARNAVFSVNLTLGD